LRKTGLLADRYLSGLRKAGLNSQDDLRARACAEAIARIEETS